MNTFTKTLSPTFRIAYLVLPKNMEKDFEEKLGFYHNTVSSLDQLVLADFIKEGCFERHISRERKFYKELHKELFIKLEPLTKEFNLDVIESASGLHFLIQHQFDIEDYEIEKIIDNTDLNIHTISHYMDHYANTKKLVLSYSNLEVDKLDDFIEKLSELLSKIKS